MLCKIADLLVQVPEAGGMSPRCKDYLWQGEITQPVITIREEQYEPEYWRGIPYDYMCYLESGHVFDHYLVRHNGLRLHASALEWEGKAYLFSADSGTGKSTHRQMWQNLYGEDNVIYVSIYIKENNEYNNFSLKAIKKTRKENKELIIKEIENKLLEII